MVEQVRSVSDILDEALSEANQLSQRKATRVDTITGYAPYFIANFQAFLDALQDENATEDDFKKVASRIYDMTQRDNIFLEQYNGTRYELEALVGKMDLTIDANRRTAIYMLREQISKERASIDAVGDVDGQVGDILSGK